MLQKAFFKIFVGVIPKRRIGGQAFVGVIPKRRIGGQGPANPFFGMTPQTGFPTLLEESQCHTNRRIGGGVEVCPNLHCGLRD